MLTLQRLDRVEAANDGERDEEVVRLVRRAQAGDEVAFAALYERYAPRVFRTVTRSVDVRAAEALDVVQDVFARAQRQMGACDAWTLDFGAWLDSVSSAALRGREQPRGAPKDAPPRKR